MQKLSVISSTGGFGNHLRWLLLLDPEFNFKFTNFNISKQKFYCWQEISSSWDISYEDFCQLTHDAIDKKLLETYIENFNLSHLDFSSTENKLDSIEKYVYYPNRTWHNWLETEWKYREHINPFINFHHWIDSISPNEKVIFLIPENPEVALKSYLKFNPNLNNISKKEFVWHITKTQDHYKNLAWKNPNAFLVYSENLLNPVLDKNFYQKVITHFGLSDCYDVASRVHKLWYNLHKKSESDILVDLQKFYNS